MVSRLGKSGAISRAAAILNSIPLPQTGRGFTPGIGRCEIEAVQQSIAAGFQDGSDHGRFPIAGYRGGGFTNIAWVTGRINPRAISARSTRSCGRSAYLAGEIGFEGLETLQWFRNGPIRLCRNCCQTSGWKNCGGQSPGGT